MSVAIVECQILRDSSMYSISLLTRQIDLVISLLTSRMMVVLLVVPDYVFPSMMYIFVSFPFD